MIPLEEIIADALSLGVGTKGVSEEYEKLIKNCKSEFNVLLDASVDELRQATLPEIAQGIIRVREGKVSVEPGFDGEYGKIQVFKKGEVKDVAGQKSLL